MSLAALFAAQVTAEVKDYQAGETIFREGDPAFRVFAVERGRVRLVRYTPEGEELPLFRAEAGQTFAEAALFADQYHCTALCENAARVHAYDREAVLAGLEADPEAMLLYGSLLSAQVRELRTLLELRTIKAADERVLHYLRLKADRQGVIRQTISRKEMAAKLGLTHETFYRQLAALEKAGRLQRRPDRIVLLPIQGDTP